VVRADGPIWRDVESWGAHARETARSVGTPSILALPFSTLVDIFTHLFMSFSISRLADALVSFVGVDALSFAADVRAQDALVDRYELDSLFFTVTGLSIFTHFFDGGNRFPAFASRMCRTSAQLAMLVFSEFWTSGTLAPPTFTHVDSAATVFLGEAHREAVLTVALVGAPSVAQSLPPVYAKLLVLTLDESWIAQAKVGTVGVDAPPIQTHVLVFALVLVVALVGVGVARLTFRTLASERTNRIDAVSTGAQVRDGFALVDINTLSSFLILQESNLAVQTGGTVLARVSPRFADGSATQSLRADNSL
jgi:hypothetical protein